eukprot:gene27326-33011_t
MISKFGVESTCIRPTGLIKLEKTCVLEAYFQGKSSFDSFVVIDSSRLREAIHEVYPEAAKSMKEDLHMTVSYPGKHKVPGLSVVNAAVYKHGYDFPKVNLHVNEIHVSDDNKFASAVVAAIDTSIMFSFDNNGTPAHLTLWGYPPVMAGRKLLGQPLALRNPFIHVTDERVEASLAEKVKELQDLREAKEASERIAGALTRHTQVVDKLLTRWVIRVQTATRAWLARRRASRMRRMRRLTRAQRAVLGRFAKTAAARFRQRKADYYADYYGDYDYW